MSKAHWFIVLEWHFLRTQNFGEYGPHSGIGRPQQRESVSDTQVCPFGGSDGHTHNRNPEYHCPFLHVSKCGSSSYPASSSASLASNNHESTNCSHFRLPGTLSNAESHDENIRVGILRDIRTPHGQYGNEGTSSKFPNWSEAQVVVLWFPPLLIRVDSGNSCAVLANGDNELWSEVIKVGYARYQLSTTTQQTSSTINYLIVRDGVVRVSAVLVMFHF